MAIALLPALALHVAALTLTTAAARPQSGGGGERHRTPATPTLRFVVASAAVPATARPVTIAPEILDRELASRAAMHSAPPVPPRPAADAETETDAAAQPDSPAVPPIAFVEPVAAPPSEHGMAAAEGPGLQLDYLPRALLSVAPQPKAPIDIPFPPAVQGTVNLGTELALFIDETGTVRHVHIDGTPLPPALEEAALSTFRSARFTPGELNGLPVRSLIRVAIRFDTEPLHQAVAAAAAPPAR